MQPPYDLADHFVLCSQRFLVCEKDNPICRGQDGRSHISLIGIQDLCQRLSGIDLISGTAKPSVDSSCIGPDRHKLFFIDHRRNIAVMTVVFFQNAHSGKKTKDSRNRLPGGFFIYEICLCSIDRKSIGIPYLPVVIQSSGINRPWFSYDYIGKAKKTCPWDIILSPVRLQNTLLLFL